MLKRQSKTAKRRVHFESLENRQLLSVNVGELDVVEQPALIGDANLDGHFDSADLVQVLGAGEYEDGIAENSDFAEGDWNGDGEFDSNDLVVAFQSGAYEDFTASASKAVVQRDLQEWLDAQGTLLPVNPLLPQSPRGFFFNNNPDINGDGVDDGQRYIMFFDWAGMLGRSTSYNGQFGPAAITGKVTERPLGNGKSEVTASVHTTDALIWVTTWFKDPANETSNPGAWLRHDGPTVFGHRETELLADPSLEAARADIHFTVKIVIDEGAPLPDIVAAANANQFLSFQLVLNAEGPLTDAFGVPDGTTGRLTWGKPGLWQDGSSPANDNADNGAASLYPNDEFHLKPIGRR